MAKSYLFRMTAHPAEFGPHFVSVKFGLSESVPSETVELPFKEALEHFRAFSERTPGPHVAFLAMARRGDRKPPGFDKAETRINKREA